MGQAKLKTEQPTHYAGPRGHMYFCRNRCGTVVRYKNTNETFVERAAVPLWGLCDQCRSAALHEHAMRVLNAVIANSSTQAGALQDIQRGVRLIDGSVHDLRQALQQMPAFKQMARGPIAALAELP